MIFEEEANIPIQVYVKEPCGIQYLKTIGVFKKVTGEALFSWREVAAQAETSKSDNIELYMNGKRVFLTSWAEHAWSDNKKYMVLKDVHLVS